MSKKKSLKSSVFAQIMGYITMAILLAITVTLPSIIKWYLDFTGRSHYNFILICITFYAALIPAFTAMFFLLSLLRKTNDTTVFSEAAIKDLSIISICCFCETAIFGVLTYFFYFSALIAFAAFFMGLLLQTVKSVIAHATEIKNENDYTV